MHDRREQVLKIVCLMLGGLLAFQLARFVVKGDPARALVVPQLPSLPSEPDKQSAKGTNSSNIKQSNQTNNVRLDTSGNKGTNVSANSSSGTNRSTNSLATKDKHPTNALSVTSEKTGNQTNAVKADLGGQISKIDTNSTAAIPAKHPEAQPSLDDKSSGKKRASLLLENVSSAKSTNPLAEVTSTNSSTNKLVNGATLKSGTNSSGPGVLSRTNAMASGPPNMPGKPPEPPAEIKERVERITQGEILGPVIRPMPMALLGIAGPNAFLRSPEGQTGMIKEGDQLGTLKLLRIGTNRVLVEHEGEKKELTIFAGLGSETLLPTKEKKPNETTTTIKSP